MINCLQFSYFFICIFILKNYMKLKLKLSTQKFQPPPHTHTKTTFLLPQVKLGTGDL